MNLDGWKNLLDTFGVALLSIFGIALAAFLGVRSTVRQKVWQHFFEAKSKAISEFSEASDAFSICMLDMFNVALAYKEPPATAQQRVWGLLQHHWREQIQDPKHFAAFLANSLSDPEVLKAGHPAAIQAHQRLLVGLRNLVFGELRIAHERLVRASSNLILVAHDPSVAKSLELFAMTELGKVSAATGISDYDFEKFFEQWRAKGRACKMALRLDLNRSAKSLRHALSIDGAWKTQADNR